MPIYKTRWRDDKRQRVQKAFKARELTNMKMVVRVVYNKEGTDFSLFGPFDTYAAAERFAVRAKRVRKAAVRVEECVLHKPELLMLQEQRLGVVVPKNEE